MDKNDDCIELVIKGIAYLKKISKIQALFTNEKTTYQILLAKKDQLNIGIVIVVGDLEAQSIAIILENLEAQRPLTYDLFKSSLEIFGIKLDSVLINKLDDKGIFHCLLKYSNENKKIEFDGRAIDAINLAIRYNCSIFIDAKIFNEISINLGS